MHVHLGIQEPAASELQSAILLYANHQDTIAVQHDVAIRNGAWRLGPGRFVTADLAKRLITALDNAPLTFIPGHVVAISREAIAWYEPAQPRRMFFQCHDDPAVNAFDDQVLAQPPLLFIARRHSLSVFALCDDTRPTKETPVALAPYYNIYNDGRVCTGSMRSPDKLDPESTEAWTRAFFGSNFTHATGNKRWAHSGTYAELLASVAAAGTFDPKWLKATSLAVGDVCSS